MQLVNTYNYIYGKYLKFKNLKISTITRDKKRSKSSYF